MSEEFASRMSLIMGKTVVFSRLKVNLIWLLLCQKQTVGDKGGQI